MISPAFLIKILGCATVGAFLTIGIPVIAVKEHEKKVAADKAKDDPANITKFLTNLLSRVAANEKSAITSVETFSDKAFQAWTPTNTEKTDIATNFSEITKHMPNEFFEKLQDINLTKAAGVCHIKTFQTKINGAKKYLFIPFLKTSMQSSSTLPASNSGNDIRAKVDGTIEISQGSKSKTEWQQIAAGTAAKFSNGTQVDKKIATDLLALQKLYDDTIDRLETLGNIDPTIPGNGDMLWAYGFNDQHTC